MTYQGDGLEAIETAQIYAKYGNPYHWVAYELQRRTGARYSEIERLQWGDVVNDEYLIMEGAKGGRARLLYCPDLIEVLKVLCAGRCSGQLVPIRYGQYKRFLSQKGLCGYVKFGRKRAYTHAIRYQLANTLVQKLGRDRRVAGDILGHRSKKSINYYIIGGMKDEDS